MLLARPTKNLLLIMQQLVIAKAGKNSYNMYSIWSLNLIKLKSNQFFRVPTTGKNPGKQGILWKKIPAGKNPGIWKKWVKTRTNQAILQKHVGKYQGNFSYIYILIVSPFSRIYISWKMGKLSGKNQGICFTKLSGHPDFYPSIVFFTIYIKLYGVAIWPAAG